MQTIDILLVEDNEGDVMLAMEALQESKIVNRIQAVRNGYEALDFLLKRDGFGNFKTPNLILLDINLPQLNGQEVLKQIRSNLEISLIPVIMLSSSSSEEDISISLANGANGYLTKPIEISEFIRTLYSIKELGIITNETLNS